MIHTTADKYIMFLKTAKAISEHLQRRYIPGLFLLTASTRNM
uniref:Uncharacterized protein n=1 Tax=Arundo donax TaxID=35708 RepID=A0A0A9B1C1_ARUDO